MTNIAYIVGQDSMTILVGGNTYTVNIQHKDWDNILVALREQNEEKLVELLNPSKKIEDIVQGNIEVRGGILFYKGNSLNNCLVDRIIKMAEQGFDIIPMLCFLDNLMQNPSATAIKELYLFLEKCNLPITSDGFFCAFKRVRDDYLDFYTATMDNSVGKTVEMERGQVDDVRDNTCSHGLHFCSLDYLSNFNPGQGKIVILKINPAEVVSIPADYNNTKGRCCRYTVVGEHAEPERAFDNKLVCNDYDDEESDDYDDYEDDY